MSKSLLLLLTVAVACATLQKTRQKVLLESAINKARDITKTSAFRDEVRLVTEKGMEETCASCRSFVSMSKNVGEGESPEKAKHTLEAMLAALCDGQKNKNNEKALDFACQNAKMIIATSRGTFTEPTDRTATCKALGFCPSQEDLEDVLSKKAIEKTSQELLQDKGTQKELVSLIQIKDKKNFFNFVAQNSAAQSELKAAEDAVDEAPWAASLRALTRFSGGVSKDSQFRDKIAREEKNRNDTKAAEFQYKKAANGTNFLNLTKENSGSYVHSNETKTERTLREQSKFGKKAQEKAGIKCFPASSVVQMETGSKRMEELSVGDRVLTVDGSGKMTYSPVYMFGHAERDTIAEYVNVQTEAGVMKLSPLHFIPTNGFNYKYARDLQVGETVLQYAEKTGQFVSAEVTKLSQSFESGVYNPHTLNGKIVVDGVVASCYSNWVLDNLFPVSSLHSVYDVVFTPHKLLSVSLGYFGLDQKLAEVAGVSNPTAPTVVDPMSIQTFASFGVSLALPILVAGALFTVAKK